MFTETEERPRTFRLAGAAMLAGVLAACLLAATTASAKAPPPGTTMFVHSAASGELAGRTLTLHAVGPRVTWAHASGRSGVMSVRRMHRTVFSQGTSTATGALHVAGHHGGDELTVRLSRPRYNAARHTVSYRIRRIGGGLPGRGSHGAGGARRFGAASLSILPAAQTSGASLQAQSNIYGCPSDPQGLRCYGTVSATGLAAGSTVSVSILLSNGSTAPLASYLADRNGNLSARRLALVCDGITKGFQVTGQAPDGSTVTAQGAVPAGC